jgi:hypothetical protein
MTPEAVQIEAARRAVTQAESGVLFAPDVLRAQRQQVLDEARAHLDELERAQEAAHAVSERGAESLLTEAREGPERRREALRKEARQTRRRIDKRRREQPLSSAQKLVRAAGGDPFAGPYDEGGNAS